MNDEELKKFILWYWKNVDERPGYDISADDIVKLWKES